MKWFKHMSDAHRDPKLLSLIDEFGMEGYGMWWMICEVVADQYKATGDPELETSAKGWRNLTGIYPKKFEKVVRFLEKGRLLFVTFSEKGIKVQIPKMRELKDNHTRNLQVTDKQEKEEEKEEEEDKRNTGEDACASSAPQQDMPSRPKFSPPTVEEVSAYCRERGNLVNPEQFVAFYESNGWRVGKNKMKNWKMAVVTWEGRAGKRPGYTPRGETVRNHNDDVFRRLMEE